MAINDNSTNDNNQNKDAVLCSISFLKKRPDISHEQFYHHWQNIHGPLVKPWMEKHGFLSYTQVSCYPVPTTQIQQQRRLFLLYFLKRLHRGKGTPTNM